ncbi:LPXTG cell wall anchor domain-containing protein [Radiobacillus sp. PE A8.2]
MEQPELPDTSMGMFNILLIGIFMLLIGVIALVVIKTRKIKE